MSGSKSLRAVLDAVLNWATFAYGFFAATVEPVWHHNEVQIAMGGEMVVLALIGFLWAGQRRALGVALVITGVAAPFALLGTASLYWDEVVLFDGEAFWTTTGVGSVVGLPLAVLGVLALRRAGAPAPGRDPWWLRVVRWAVQGGLLLIVVAFRGGDWDRGIPIVYAGVALALVGLLIVLPRRFRITRRGIGVLLAFLGGAALVVTGVAQAFVGGHMSGGEALVGLVPAGVVLVVGLVLAATGRGGTNAVNGDAVPVASVADLENAADRGEAPVIDAFRDTVAD